MINVSYITLCILSTAFMQMIFIYNYGKMTSQVLNINSKNILITIILSLIVCVNNLFNLIYLRIPIGIIVTGINAKIIFKNRIKFSLFYALMYDVVVVLLELILTPLISYNIENIEIFNKYFIYLKSIFSILVSLITILVFKNRRIIYFINKIKLIIYDNLSGIKLIFIVVFLINYLSVNRAFETNNIYMIFNTLICTLCIILSLRIIVNDKYNLKIVNERNRNLKDSHKAYSHTIEECREFKHNFKNEIYSIKSLLPLEHQEKINNIIKKYNTDYEWIDKIDEIPEGLQGLIYLKKKEAMQKKINIIINSNGIIKTNNEDYIDLCDVIGILIDNAIEASINAKSKIIEITIKNDKNKLNICIINKYSNKIDLMKIGKKNYSTKEYKSGIGLNYIKKMKNHNIKVNYKIINNLFITNVLYK